MYWQVRSISTWWFREVQEYVACILGMSFRVENIQEVFSIVRSLPNYNAPNVTPLHSITEEIVRIKMWLMCLQWVHKFSWKHKVTLVYVGGVFQHALHPHLWHAMLMPELILEMIILVTHYLFIHLVNANRTKFRALYFGNSVPEHFPSKHRLSKHTDESPWM